MMKALVTGGAGFIGSHIVDALIQRGDEVAVIDNLCSGSRQNVNRDAQLIEMHIGDEGLSAAFERQKPDIVIHQAAQINLRRSVEEPLFDARENIVGSLNVIVNCARYGVDKLVYSSSGGAIYGEPQYLPVDEKHPVFPLSQYGVSKYCVEHYIQLYAHQSQMDYAILRYANVYGPRQNPFGEAGVIAIFARQMMRGEQPSIFGRGDKTRDYTHVSDVVAANLTATERGSGVVCNISTGVESSDQQIYDAVASAVGYSGPAQYTEVRPGEIQRISLDCGLAAK